VAGPQPISTGIASQIGRYSDAVRIPAGYDTIVTSGTPGLAPDGTVPEGMTAQATQAWENIRAILAAAGAGLADIVSVRQWLTRQEDLADYVAVRSQYITHQPAFMLAINPALVWPSLLVELEVAAAVPAAG
jgi:enamine deaminase RidA (YjgF/YER057c/UK114 family)